MTRKTESGEEQEMVSADNPDHVEIALKINKIIHDACSDVPHGIGQYIVEYIKNDFIPEE